MVIEMNQDKSRQISKFISPDYNGEKIEIKEISSQSTLNKHYQKFNSKDPIHYVTKKLGVYRTSKYTYSYIPLNTGFTNKINLDKGTSKHIRDKYKDHKKICGWNNSQTF